MIEANRFLARPLAIAALLLSISPFATVTLQSEEVFPSEDWVDDYDPLASPDAVPGGRIRIGAHQYPSSFNYYLDANVFSAALFGTMFETLLSTDPITVEFEPSIATKVVVSDDKRAFTFTIDERARWSDGKPITAADVAFTYDVIMNPDFMIGGHRVGFEKFEKPEVIDDQTIRFTANEVHWRNLLTLGTFAVLPKHHFEGRDFNRENFEFPVVSGPYRLGRVSEGISVQIERREDWWQRGAKRYEGTANFEVLEFRFYADRETAFEAFVKDEYDLHAVYTSHIWAQRTDSEPFKKNWIVKQEVYNYDPPAWQGFAINMRHEKYKDARVRQALAHLLDRDRLNAEIMFNAYSLHQSYWEDLYGPEHPNPNPKIEYDVEKARALLSEAGWEANPRTGKLEKDGVPFVINFLTRDPSTDKFLVIYRESLANVGIDLAIDRKDWAAWTKDMDEFNYEMTWAAWGGSIYKDPQYHWHSTEADRRSSANITGFKSDKVDALIAEQVGEFDIAKRNDIARQIDPILYAETPYILLWYSDHTRLLYWNRFGTPDTVLSKYSDERGAWTYWWYDPDAAADLERARGSGSSLPQREYRIEFDDYFDGN